MKYPNGSMGSWAYDDAHNVKNRTTTGGEIQNFAYDNRNRKTREWWNGYPTDAEWREFGYDAASHLTLATNGIGDYGTHRIAAVTRVYDNAGRLSGDEQTIYDVNGVVANTKDVNYPSYDDSGKLLRMYREQR